MQKLLENWRSHYKLNLLSYRLLVYILMCSTLLAILSTGVQLFWDYRNDVNKIEQRMKSIEAGYLDSLAASLWRLDQDQIGIQLDGIMKLPDIGYVSITEIVGGKTVAVFSRGQDRDNYPIVETHQLYYNDTLVGTLDIKASLDNVYDRLLQRALVILGSQAVKTFLVSICILVIVQYLVVRHLNTLSAFTRRLHLDNLDEQLDLNKPSPKPNKADSIDQLAHTLTAMRDNIRLQLSDKKKAQQQLEQLNEELEQRVQYRTATLKHTNNRLSEALESLTQAKDQLVESEKMAALGELVSGIAHEINTPVNLSLESATQIQNSVAQLNEALTAESPDPQQIHQLQQQLKQACENISMQLKRTGQLVSSFKQIAVDQSQESAQIFKVKDNIQQAVDDLKGEVQTLQPECNIEIDCDPALKMESYPSALTQVYQHLLLNSLQHGFKKDQQGQIRIAARQDDDELVVDFSDNGKGIPEQIKHRIFEPFVTTGRGDNSSSGLGTHLVYNLVTQLLGGKINVESARGEGTHYEIRLPIRAERLPDDENDDLW